MGGAVWPGASDAQRYAKCLCSARSAEAAIAKVFAKICQNKLFLQIFVDAQDARGPRELRAVKISALNDPCPYQKHQKNINNGPSSSMDHRASDRDSFRGNSFTKKRFRSPFGRHGAFGKSRATRRQNPSLLRRLATPKTSKKRFGKNSSFLDLGNQFFVIFPGFWRS